MKGNDIPVGNSDGVIGAVSFVELDRLFASIDKDKEVPLETPPNWGRSLYGWVGWAELLSSQRVVLLAEAGSGKSEELQARCRTLCENGQSAFFLRVEDLADLGLDASLDANTASLFEKWKSGTEKGYFFLDSVDEARLNQKSFETALKRLARELGTSLQRAHVVVSCRISDWRGRKDYDAVVRLLPVPAPLPERGPDRDGALLNPIFQKREPKASPTEAQLSALSVVRLVALSDANRRALAKSVHVPDIDAFIAAISQYGLEKLADTPSDLLELAEYWKTHKKFSSLRDMTEHAVKVKLAEEDQSRSDNNVLSLGRARLGAERIAAALTLGQTFVIRAPGQEPDPTLSSGAIDAKEVLPGWTDAERAALLRRRIFAPATYGRVRFHHRSTQEFLTASWFDRLLNAGCPHEHVNSLFFASRYGTDTVVPSLRAEAAWLAINHADIRSEIIRREPGILIHSGDPGSLPIEARKALLLRYGELNRTGDISDDRLDDRAIWMFAHTAMSEAILAAWGLNDRSGFRTVLLRIVREARILGCRQLWIETIADPRAKDYLKMAAVDAALACGDEASLTVLATDFIANPGKFAEGLATQLAVRLFPRYLTVENLLFVAENCLPASKESVSGFAYNLADYSVSCRSREERLALVGGLANLAMQPPHQSDYDRLSSRHFRVAEHLVPIALQLIDEVGNDAAPPALIKALMAIERRDHYRRHNDEDKLRQAVKARPNINRGLFWADVDDVEFNSPTKTRPTGDYLVMRHGGGLWGSSQSDLAWILEDIKSPSRVLGDRLMMLDTALGVLSRELQLDARIADLRAAVVGVSELETALEERLRPRAVSEDVRRFNEESRESKRQQDVEDDRAKDSWLAFRDELAANPSRVFDKNRLVDPEGSGQNDLVNLTRWLMKSTGLQDEEAVAIRWREIAVGFDNVAISEAYRDGMKSHWRLAKLRWPVRVAGGGITTYTSTELAFAGVALEASEDPDWAQKLSDEDARRAVELACYSGKNYPPWLDDLVARHSDVAIAVIREALTREWAGQHSMQQSLLYHYAHTPNAQPAPVCDLIGEVILEKEASDTYTAGLGIRALRRNHGGIDAQDLIDISTERLSSAVGAENSDRVVIALAQLFSFDAEAACHWLRRWIDCAPELDRKKRAVSALAGLFGRDHALATSSLNTMSVTTLTDLSKLAFLEVSPLDDVQHEGVYSPDARDEAESARSAILSEIYERPGEEAFDALSMLGNSGIAGIRPIRFRELAHGKVERDAEIKPWKASDVVAFENSYLLPIQSAEGLLSALLRSLEDIKNSLKHEDVSSKALLRNAANENQVQGWLAERLKAMSRGRFHIHREPEVADKKEPDIVASATTILAETALEVKKTSADGWTVLQLEDALRVQLAELYLLPSTRRHGVLVITHHQARTWRAPENGSVMSFSDVIARLTRLAASITTNASGPISLHVIGIDVS